MQVDVYKFGGASIADADRILNVGSILQGRVGAQTAVVVSAMGKSTNRLEAVVNAYWNNDSTSAVNLLDELKKEHLSIAQSIGIDQEPAMADIMDSFVEIDWMIEDEPHDSFDYIYDQIVSVGEIVSSKIVHYHALSLGLRSQWLDVRDVLFTDEVYRDAKVDWTITQAKIRQTLEKSFEQYDMVITQGFIGSTRDNHTTTLGREGSDYTAAIFSYCLEAKGMHIWKDVPGVLTGDPSLFDNVSLIQRLSYKEAIEMTYYGAKVIHPKTIKPIQNKNIPMYVRPFGNVQSMGTSIGAFDHVTYPPIIVLENNQTLLSISVKDFSFVAEKQLTGIFKTMAKLRIKANMMRNTAISFTLCVPNHDDKIEHLIKALDQEFTITQEKDLELITIRHFNDQTIADMQAGKLVLFEERLNDMIQMVVKSVPNMKRKS